MYVGGCGCGGHVGVPGALVRKRRYQCFYNLKTFQFLQ